MKTYTFERKELDILIGLLKTRGYKVLGPIVYDSAIIYDEITDSSQLPAGWTDEQSNGKYRLKHQKDNALFNWTVGPQSWKKFLFPPIQSVLKLHRSGRGFKFTDESSNDSRNSSKMKYAFFGVRPCELKAIAIQDKVFLSGPFIDNVYESKRKDAFIVAINCSRAGGTCFCSSLGTGPRAKDGFDLALTEILEGNRHYFVVEVGTEKGEEILSNINRTDDTEHEIEKAILITENTKKQINRTIDISKLANNLYQNIEHPRWEKIAETCLSCANCTMVCPTCFCSTIEDTTDLKGTQAERIRRWDSCFTLDFSYIHGGSVRSSVKSRYRQWLMHKFSFWMDQFGTFGCVGCGRCITWCPVSIDIMQEAKTLTLQDNNSIEK